MDSDSDLFFAIERACEQASTRTFSVHSEWSGYLPFAMSMWMEVDGRDIRIAFDNQQLKQLESAGKIVTVASESIDEDFGEKVTYRLTGQEHSTMSNNLNWEVWVEDTFDRGTPNHKDAEGQGLVQGLAALWVRHLRETVQPAGISGFMRFTLRYGPNIVQLPAPNEHWAKLRSWVIGDSVDTALLDSIAVAHAQLLEQGAEVSRLAEAVSRASDPTALLGDLTNWE